MGTGSERLFEYDWEEEGVGAYSRLGAYNFFCRYSRWALIRDWVLIRINTVY